MAQFHRTSRDTSHDFFTEVLVIGGGLSGMYALHKFKKLGIAVNLVEAGSDFGGTWHHNRYPGARVDSEFPFYQLSIPEVYNTFDFTERFPSDVELRRYVDHVAKVLDLRKAALFNTVVEGITWNEQPKQWTCCTKTKRVITCKYLVLCTGSSYKKYLPQFRGLEKFHGTLLHSASFDTRENIDMESKRIAVIGNGATGVQLIQELGKREGCTLTAFIRTPIIALPMKQRTVSKTEQRGLKSFYDSLFRAAKQCKTGFPYNSPPKPFADATNEEKRIHLERLWDQGGFSFFLSNYMEFVTDRKVNEYIYNFWAEKTRARVTDPTKRDIVAPIKQANLFGVKRPSLEQDYYEVVDRPNVHLVNVKETPVQEMTEDGILTNDGQHRKFDVIVLATGYDAMTGSLMDLWIRDRDGRSLQDLWRDGVETYLGLMIVGMPNMFMAYSPQAPTALSNGSTVIEIQVDWVVDAITKMKDENLETIEPRKEFAQKWREDIQEMNSKTLYPAESSWYMGANIPGKVREQLMYIGGVDAYQKAIMDALSEWKGFDVQTF